MSLSRGGMDLTLARSRAAPEIPGEEAERRHAAQPGRGQGDARPLGWEEDGEDERPDAQEGRTVAEGERRPAEARAAQGPAGEAWEEACPDAEDEHGEEADTEGVALAIRRHRHRRE